MTDNWSISNYRNLSFSEHIEKERYIKGLKIEFSMLQGKSVLQTIISFGCFSILISQISNAGKKQGEPRLVQINFIGKYTFREPKTFQVKWNLISPLLIFSKASGFYLITKYISWAFCRAPVAINLFIL